MKIEIETEGCPWKYLAQTAKELGVELNQPVEVLLKGVDTKEIERAMKAHEGQKHPLHLIFDSCSAIEGNKL